MSHDGKVITRPDPGGRERFAWMCECGYLATGLPTVGMAYTVGDAHHAEMRAAEAAP